MTTIITFTKPMSEFNSLFANGSEIARNVDLTTCTEFWAKGTNSELLIYSGRQILYSCCYTEAYGNLYITSVWGKNGCEYNKPLDYDEIEKNLPVLSLDNAKIGAFYRFCDGWQRLDNIYKISEEYAKEHQLYYMERATTTDWNGNKHDFALRN